MGAVASRWRPLAQGQQDAVVIALASRTMPASTSSPTGSSRASTSSGASSSRSKGSTSPAWSRSASAPTDIARTCRRSSPYAVGARFTRRGALARAHTNRALKWTMPGPMTVVDTVHEHYGSRARLGMEVARLINEEARELEAAWRRRDPARRARLQRLHGRGAATGASRRWTGRSKVSRVARPCTSATATASRPTSTGRRHWAASGASTS